MKTKIVVWKCDGPSSIYKAQVEVSQRSKKKMIREMKEWELFGEGWNHRAKRAVLMLRREFNSREDLLQWAAEFAYPVSMVNARGNEVQLKQRRASDRSRSVA